MKIKVIYSVSYEIEIEIGEEDLENHDEEDVFQDYACNINIPENDSQYIDNSFEIEDITKIEE